MSSTGFITYGVLALLVVVVVLLIALLRRGSGGSDVLARPVRDELRAARAEQATQGKSLREEVTAAAKTASDTQLRLIGA